MSAKKASTAQPRNRERATETLQRPARSRAEACPKPHAARVGRPGHPGRRPSKPKLCWGHGRISLVFLYSLLYFGDVIYCKYPSSKYRREYRFPLCEACLYIVKKKTRAAFPLFTPSHRPKLDRARSPPRAVRRARAVCPCQRPLPPIDRLWADSCKRFSAYRWWPVAGTGLPDAAAHDSCDATDTPLCC